MYTRITLSLASPPQPTCIPLPESTHPQHHMLHYSYTSAFPCVTAAATCMLLPGSVICHPPTLLHAAAASPHTNAAVVSLLSHHHHHPPHPPTCMLLPGKHTSTTPHATTYSTTSYSYSIGYSCVTHPPTCMLLPGTLICHTSRIQPCRLG